MSTDTALLIVIVALLGIAVCAPLLAVLLWRELTSHGRSGSRFQENAGSLGDGIPGEPFRDTRNNPSVTAAPRAERRSTRASA